MRVAAMKGCASAPFLQNEVLVPFGIGIGQVSRARPRDARTEETRRPGSLSRASAPRELAAVLAAGGDPGAVSVDGDPSQAAVAIRIVEGDPSSAESTVLRRLSRAGLPLVVVRRGGAARIPYVPAGNVLETGERLPVAELAAAIARVADDNAPALAARLPVLRGAVTRRLVGTTRIEERGNRRFALAEAGPPAAPHARAEPHVAAARAQPWRGPSTRPAGAGDRSRAGCGRCARPWARRAGVRATAAAPGAARQSCRRVRRYAGARRCPAPHLIASGGSIRARS